MASIRKNKNGTYTAEIYAGRGAAGKKIREYITKDSLKECKIAARDRETEIEELGSHSLSTMRFDICADKWLELEKSRLKPSAHLGYKKIIETHFKPHFGNWRMGKITELHIKEYISARLTKVSAKTVRNEFFTLSAIFRFALKGRSPLRDLEPPEAKQYVPYIIEDEEFKLFHNAVRGTWDEIALLLIAWNSFRPSEIFALSKDDILFASSEIRIDEGKTLSEDGYVFTEPKSKKGHRLVATHPYLMNLLKEHIKNNMGKQRLFDTQPRSYSKRWANIITTHNKLFEQKQACIKAGESFENKARGGQVKTALVRTLNIQDKPLPQCRFYDMRHYHASVLYKCGVPDQYAAVRMGHDVSVLKKVYQHLHAREESKMHDKIKDIFTP